MSSDYSLAGIQIFGNEFTKYLDQTVLDRMKQIILLVNSFTNFTAASKLEKLLTISLQLDSTNASIPWLTTILSNTGCNTRCADFTGTKPSVCDPSLNNNGIVTLADVVTNNLNSDSLSNDIISHLNMGSYNLEKNLLSAMTSTIDSPHQQHLTFISDICFQIFKKHYNNLFASKTSYPFTGALDIQQASDTTLGKYCQDLLSRIKTVSTNASTFNINANSDYYNSVCLEIARYANTQAGLVKNPIFVNTFLSCYYPYIMFSFILGQIAVVNNSNSLDKAPRNFIIRRSAILCAYIFEYYMILNMYEHCNTANQQIASNILQTINTCITNDFIPNQSVTYANLHSDTMTNIQSSNQLQNIKRDVNLSKNNLNKSVLNDVGINKSLYWSIVIKWWWISLLIAYIVFGIVFIAFFLTSENLYILASSSLIIFFIVAISIFISVIKF